MFSSKLKIGLCQIKQTPLKEKNIEYAKYSIDEAAKNGANLIILGECFNCIFQSEWLIKAAEDLTGKAPAPTFEMLQNSAKEHKVYIVGGSIPEIGENGKFHNTSLVFNKDGKVIAKYRKTHLFDVDFPGKMVFKESDTFEAGRDYTIFDTEYGRMGLAICYDIRFPELSLLMSRKGAKILLYPAVFNLTTGPLHWELLLRSRALDNQVFTVGCQNARYTDDSKVYQAWGHSTVVDPLGRVIVTTEHDPAILYADLDLQLVDEARKMLPYESQKRYDIYTLDVTKRTEPGDTKDN
jgi:omega-amidase